MTMAPSSPALVEGRELYFSYDGHKQVVEGVSFAIRQGEFWGLIGPNGAGKSTLLRILAGGLVPASGTLLFNGKNENKITKQQIARIIAYVPQRTVLSFPFTVQEMVLMGRQPYAGLAVFEDERDFEVVEQVMAITGVAGLRERLFHELSGGEQQLVILARALAQEAPILVLDEPTTFLDLKHQWEILSLLQKLAQEGRSVLATFHDLNAAARWCSRLALMVKGKIVAQGLPAEVLQEPLLRDAYDVPVRVEHTPSGNLRVELP